MNDSVGRLVDYFAVVGLGDELKLLDDEQREAPWLAKEFQGQVLDRVPVEDHQDSPFPPGISLFCVPGGFTLSEESGIPKFHSFAATHGNGDRIYGACLTFYEPVDAELRAKLEEFAVASPPPSPIVSPVEVSSTVCATSNDDVVLLVDDDEPMAKQTDNSTTRVAKEDSDLMQKVAATLEPEVRPKVVLRTGSNGDALPRQRSKSNKKSCTVVHSRKKCTLKDLPKRLYAPKCICLLSHCPFLEGFRCFLKLLYRSSLTPTKVPIERTICNFVREVPLPPRGQVKVQYNVAFLQGNMDEKTIEFKRAPPNNPLAFSWVSLRPLFEYLDLENVELVLVCALLEYKVLFVSSQLSLLPTVSEAILTLMYPFVWRHVYIPLLPKPLVDFLNAPMPFLIGTHVSFVNPKELAPDVVVVNLDTNTVTCWGGRPSPRSPRANAMRSRYEQTVVWPPPQLPYKERKKLFKAWSSLRGLLKPVDARYKFRGDDMGREIYDANFMSNSDLAFTNALPPDMIDNQKVDAITITDKEIASACFRLFVSTFKNYRDFLIFPSKEVPFPPSLFRNAAFLKSQPQYNHHFLVSFLSTQAWQDFLEKRCFPRHDYDVMYFDESIIAKRNRSRFTKKGDTPFLKDTSMDITKTVVAPTPDLSGLKPDAEYKYAEFPRLDPQMMSHREAAGPLANAARNVPTTRKKHRRHSIAQFATPQSVVYTVWFIAFSSTRSAKAQAMAKSQAQHQDLAAINRAGSWAWYAAAAAHHAPAKSASEPTAAQQSSISVPSLTSSTSVGAPNAHPAPAPAPATQSGPPTSSSTSVSSTPVSVTQPVRQPAEQQQDFGLDLALDVLDRARALNIRADSVIFRHLMEACGACGQPELAVQFLEEMERAGYQPSTEMYSTLLQVFVMNGDPSVGYEALAESMARRRKREENMRSMFTGGADATDNFIDAVNEVKRNIQKDSKQGSRRGSFRGSPVPPASPQPRRAFSVFAPPVPPRASRTQPANSIFLSSSIASRLANTLSGSASTPGRADNNASYSHSGTATPPTRVLSKEQQELIDLMGNKMRFSQITGYGIDTNDQCTECDNPLNDGQIRQGWTQDSNDYTTQCMHCKERFVARFTIYRLHKRRVRQSVSTPAAAVTEPASGTGLSAMELAMESNPGVSTSARYIPPAGDEKVAFTVQIDSPAGVQTEIGAGTHEPRGTPSVTLSELASGAATPIPMTGAPAVPARTRVPIMAAPPAAHVSAAMAGSEAKSETTEPQEDQAKPVPQSSWDNSDKEKQVPAGTASSADVEHTPVDDEEAPPPLLNSVSAPVAPGRRHSSITPVTDSKPGSEPVTPTVEYALGDEPTISCEYLSPLVLRKELERAIDQEGGAYLADPHLSERSPTLFWNLHWHFCVQHLPTDFLPMPAPQCIPPAAPR